MQKKSVYLASAKTNRLRESRGDLVFNFVNNALLVLILAITLYPLIYIVSCSFSDPTAVASGGVWLWPVRPTLIGYTGVFENGQVITGYRNSLMYAVLGTIVNIIVTFLAAYPLSRKKAVPARNGIMFVFLFTMLFSGGMIPSYLVVRSLKMLNTIWAMIIPGAMSVWNMIITRTFLEANIPEELYESAELDGCGDFRMLLRIVLPLSGTIIAVNALFYAVGHWNSYFNAMLYLRNAELVPLQVVLRNILIMNQITPGMFADVQELTRREAMRTLLKYSLIVIASLPLMVAYPFVQKFFVKGLLIGSIKG